MAPGTAGTAEGGHCSAHSCPKASAQLQLHLARGLGALHQAPGRWGLELINGNCGQALQPRGCFRGLGVLWNF